MRSKKSLGRFGAFMELPQLPSVDGISHEIFTSSDKGLASHDYGNPQVSGEKRRPPNETIDRLTDGGTIAAWSIVVFSRLDELTRHPLKMFQGKLESINPMKKIIFLMIKLGKLPYNYPHT